MLKRPKGFSLIELLVVLSIIALLLGLLLPALGAAKESGRAVVCLSNLRTIGQAVVMYAGDNDGQFPISTHTVHGPSVWLVSLQSYGVTSGSRKCPSDPDEDRPASYATNDYMEPDFTGSTSPYPVFTRWSQVPSASLVVYSSHVRGPGFLDHLHARLNNWTMPDQIFDALAVNTHRGAANYLFVDGHAKSIAWKQIATSFSEDHNFFNPSRVP